MLKLFVVSWVSSGDFYSYLSGVMIVSKMKDISLTLLHVGIGIFIPAFNYCGGYLKFQIPVTQVGKDDLSVILH